MNECDGLYWLARYRLVPGFPPEKTGYGSSVSASTNRREEIIVSVQAGDGFGRVVECGLPGTWNHPFRWSELAPIDIVESIGLLDRGPCPFCINGRLATRVTLVPSVPWAYPNDPPRVVHWTGTGWSDGWPESERESPPICCCFVKGLAPIVADWSKRIGVAARDPNPLLRTITRAERAERRRRSQALSRRPPHAR